jgi:hypothetical protein
MADAVRLSLNRSLADRYELSRELGQGRMATVYLRAISATIARSRSRSCTRISPPSLSGNIYRRSWS